jgi:hypothetical protein
MPRLGEIDPGDVSPVGPQLISNCVRAALYIADVPCSTGDIVVAHLARNGSGSQHDHAAEPQSTNKADGPTARHNACPRPGAKYSSRLLTRCRRPIFRVISTRLEK